MRAGQGLKENESCQKQSRQIVLGPLPALSDGAFVRPFLLPLFALDLLSSPAQRVGREHGVGDALRRYREVMVVRKGTLARSHVAVSHYPLKIGRAHV
jgi:hypothetical protein